MDSAAIAALFTEDGEVTVVGQPPVRGRAAIARQLASFIDFHVLAETLTADRLDVAGREGLVAGTYRQRVRIPSGEVVEVHGSYTADWRREADATWHIRRMTTTPEP